MSLIWNRPHTPGKWGQQAPGCTTEDLHLDRSSPGIQTLGATIQGPFQLLPTEVSEGYFVFFQTINLFYIFFGQFFNFISALTLHC